MTRTHTSGTNRPASPRFYRRLMVGSIAVGVLGGLALRFLDYHLAGEAVYWLGIVGFFAVWRGTPVTLFDERDASLERRASHLTLQVLAAVLVVGASAARVLPRVTSVTVPPEVVGALYGYVGVFVVFAVAFLRVRARP